MMKGAAWILLGVVAGAIAACTTSPEGRSQLVLLPAGQMDAMGAKAFLDMKKKTPTTKDPRKTAYVRCITDLLVKQLDRVDEGEWEVQVFEDNQINAFALPGRKIGVYTGIMTVGETPGQLAAVLGHEVGHVIANHGNERVSTALVAQLGLAGVSAVLEQKEKNKNYGLLMAALGVGVNLGVLLPHSRSHESEADMIGQNLMARAGFDPRESVLLWQNMAKKSGGGVPEFLSTHPAHDTRIKQLQKRMDDSLRVFAASPFKERAARCTL